MRIRTASLSDSEILSSLSMDVQCLHAEQHPDVFKMPDNDDFAVSFFREMLADPAVSIFIAEEKGEAVGYILCQVMERSETPFTFARRSLHVDQISVRPLARGRGVGTALLQQAEMLANELNLTRLELASWDFNLQAHALFERLGFQKFQFRFWRQLK